MRFSRSLAYTSTIEMLRLLYKSLVKVLESWECFDGGEMQYFEVNEQETHRRVWGSYVASIEKDMMELRFMKNGVRPS
jgi:hypothetical protein